jgi:hypothetical protein
MTTENPQTQEAQENTPALTLSDLASIRNIIEVSTSRGAFKPNELREVGTVYEKLDAFLKAIAVPQPQASEQPQGE